MVIDPRELEASAAVRGTARAVPTCRKCGYDVRGMRVGEQCPECGTPVRALGPATRGRDDSISLAPHGYLQRLSTAAIVLAVTSVLIPVAPIVLGFLGVNMERLQYVLQAAFLVVVAACAAVICRPRQSPLDESDSLPRERRITRWTATVGLGLSCLTPLLEYLISPHSSVGAGYELAIGIAWVVINFVGTIAYLALLLWITRLAVWAKDDALVDRLRVVTFLVGIPLVVFGVIAMLGTFGWATLGGFAATILIGGIVLFFGLILLLVCLIQFANLARFAMTGASKMRQREERRLAKEAAPLPMPVKARAIEDDVGVSLRESGSHATGTEAPTVAPSGRFHTIEPIDSDDEGLRVSDSGSHTTDSQNPTVAPKGRFHTIDPTDSDDGPIPFADDPADEPPRGSNGPS